MIELSLFVWRLARGLFYSKVFLIIVAVIVALISVKFLGANNIIEEKAEEFIEEKTGIEIEISPTEEDKKMWEQHKYNGGKKI